MNFKQKKKFPSLLQRLANYSVGGTTPMNGKTNWTKTNVEI